MAGTIESLNKVVAQYISGSTLKDATTAIKTAAANIKNEAQMKYAAYYVRVFDKLSQSDNYVAKELARLEGILAKGGLAPTKIDEITSKTNILRKFTEKVEEAVVGKDEL